MKIAAPLIVVFALAACASTNENLQMESARSIGGGVMPESVKINNVDRGMTSVKWDAESAKGSYKCSADDMLRRVLCVKKE